MRIKDWWDLDASVMSIIGIISLIRFLIEVIYNDTFWSELFAVFCLSIYMLARIRERYMVKVRLFKLPAPAGEAK